MRKINVGLFNDAFPPVIDGVSNAVINYAYCIQNNFGKAVVATPYYPKTKDDYPFTVVRYPSVNMGKNIGYRVGNFFAPKIIRKLLRERLDIIHVHSPFTAALLARIVRKYANIPIVYTYHTKFDIDLEKRVGLAAIKNVSVKLILNNINACDEVWVVSDGAGENLRSLGYTGEYEVMENGTDFLLGRAEEKDVEALRMLYNISAQEAVFIFVGRLMWYKNIGFTLEALSKAKKQGAKFKMMIVGDGFDREEIETYTRTLQIHENCIFTGVIKDRELLRAHFTLANLQLFPSTYDTNGLVVKEAAACYCPSLLIAGSCAAEGINHGENGLLIQESVDEYARIILEVCNKKDTLRQIGENAADQIYKSWDTMVNKAYIRYVDLIDRYR